MPEPSPTKSLVTEFFATARGRLISALTVVILLLGIVAEVISIVTGYYNMISARYNSISAGAESEAKAGSAYGPGQPAVMPTQEGHPRRIPQYEPVRDRYDPIEITSVEGCNNHPALNTNNPEWNGKNQIDCRIGARRALGGRAREGSSTLSYQYTPHD
jgi:hypothetical protein